MKRIVVFLSILLILMAMVSCSRPTSTPTELPTQTPPSTSPSYPQLSVLPLPPMPQPSPSPTLLVIINPEVYEPIQPEIAQYKADLEKEGYTVKVMSAEFQTPEQLRETIKSQGPDGVFLIGDFPVAWFEIQPYTLEVAGGTYGHETHDVFPTDLYYMDLDGIWTDSDGNGYFDQHTGEKEPEVFLGRLTASTLGLLGDEVSIIKNYLSKTHLYRNGLMETKPRALIYGVSEFNWGSLERIQKIYPVMDIVELQQTPEGRIEFRNGSKADFLQKIHEGYQFVKPGSIGHSGPYDMAMGEEALTCADLLASNPRSQFYIVGSCLNGFYVDSVFIAGCFAYGGEGLIALGNSSGGGNIGRGQAFYEWLEAGGSFGEAVKAFFAFILSIDEPARYFGPPPSPVYPGSPIPNQKKTPSAILTTRGPNITITQSCLATQP